MDKLTQMRISDNYDDDGLGEEELYQAELEKKEDFKKEYKKFYSDIKLSIKEDW